MLCVFLILLGGYIEARSKLYSNFKSTFAEYRYSSPETFNVEGDPGLVKWIRNQRESLPRPDFSDSGALQEWKASLRRNLLDIFSFSKNTSYKNIHYRKISSTVVESNIKRDFISFRSFDDTSIPAYLFTPSLDGPKPAIIVLPGHVRENNEGITQAAGLVDSYQRKVAHALAKAGYITLTIEIRGFGYLGEQANTEHRLVAYNAILGGSFYKAVISKDIKTAVDLLQSLDEVDPDRIGITGVSFGGEMAATYAALDERIKVVVFQGFGGKSGTKQGVAGTSIEQPHYCHIIPGYNTYLFQEDIFLLISPRPLLGVRGKNDYSNDPEFVNNVQSAYKLLNASSAFEFKIVPGGHEYFTQPAIKFFMQYL